MLMNPTPQATQTRRLLLALTCTMAMAPSAWSQTTAEADAAKAAADANAANVPVENAPAKTDDKLVLSPFVVTTEKDSGYFAENTLMGSRLNSKISDLAASITVVTKQQLDDTGALDINDVFLYESNTEGASTYTPVALNRNNLTDNIGGYSGDDGSSFGIATANRVRGLGRVDTAQNNYPTIARLAFDSYNTNSVEISRGPNSMLFGTGAPAGIINQSSATAVLGQQKTQVQLRGGSFDAWRVSMNTNIPIGDKIAIFLAGLYDSRGFQRKPSSDIYRRQYGAITYRPFRNTTITASFEHYDNYNNRPNFLPPQDRVTPWLEAGRPGFNPSTQRFTFQDTGVVTQPYLNSTFDTRFVSGVTPPNDAALTTTTSAFYIPGLAFLAGRQTLFYADGKEVGFWVPNTTNGSGTFNQTINGVTGVLNTDAALANRTQAQRLIAAARLVQTAADPVPVPPASTGATGYAVWVLPHITDQSIYDWEKYNISGANYGNQEATVANVDIQQQILPNLNFSAGWFRQEFEEWTHYGLGQANQAPRLYVDANTHNLDGTVNPYYGSPYVFDSQADTFYLPESNDNWRAMLSYELDLTNRNGWTRWLGKHRLLGLVSEQKQWKNNLRYRLSYTGGDGRFLPNVNPAVANNFRYSNDAASIQRVFYLGQNNTATVDRGLSVIGNPGYGGPSHSTLNYYNWNTASFSKADMTYAMNLLNAGANYGVATRKTESKSFAWQGYLWEERIIPTMGWRKDEVTLAAFDNRDFNNVPLTTPTNYTAGYANDGFWNHLGPERTFAGTTKTRGVVARLLKGWKGIEQRANDGSFIADFARNLSVHYNESDNFNPPAGIQVDFFNRQLAPPSGKGKDYGFGVNLFDNKLVVRLNWYEASNENALSNGANTVVGRMQRIDTVAAKRWAEYVVRIRSGQNPAVETQADFHNVILTPTQEAAIRDLQWGNFEFKDYNWPNYGSATVNSTESNLSKGKELQMTYNPLRNWTIKWTVGQQQASYSKVGPEVAEWEAFRKPQWQALTAPDIPNVITKQNGNQLFLANFWNGYGFTQGATFDDANSNSAGALNTPATTYTSIVEAIYLPVKALQNTTSSNLREWTTSVLSNYTFQKGRLKGFSVGGSWRWADKAIAGYQSLLDPSTYARPNATTANIVFPDLTKPIYTPAEASVDLWASYTRKIFSDKVRLKIQLNVRDALEDGGLQAVVFNQDGSPAQYRIKDPRTWFVTTTFDF
jgi:outer membrane receptor protein involved in Fe transport